MNNIQINGTIFNPKEVGGKKMFRLAFYNGKNANGDFNKDGYIDCKVTNKTVVNDVIFTDREKVELQGFLTCDYWEYQGKKYSQLTIVVNEIGRDYGKKKQEPQRQIDKEWDDAPVVDDLPNDFVPF